MPFRHCLADPAPAIYRAARMMESAAQAHASGARAEAIRLLAAANDVEVRAYTEMVWGAGARQRFGFVTVANPPPVLVKTDRPIPRMPTQSTCAELIARDGFHCRFCGIPVVDVKTRKLICKLYPEAVSWGTTNSSQHAALQCMWLQFDHVLPNGRGGSSDLENMVITCAPCNFGRMDHTIEEARLSDPRLELRSDTWDGYSRWDGLQLFHG
jgi:5-methylcytosine-specific restriction endonuclease McrA